MYIKILIMRIEGFLFHNDFLLTIVDAFEVVYYKNHVYTIV
jgi:hypothetical protein